jgi:peptide deformylase
VGAGLAIVLNHPKIRAYGGFCIRNLQFASRASAAACGRPAATVRQVDGARESTALQDPHMALLTILEYPDPRLRKIAVPVAAVTPEIRKLVQDLADTMYHAPGIGLAATQVNVHKRVIVMDISETRDALRVFINPVIVAAAGEAEAEEGCLSVPGYYDKVTRAANVRVQALDERGASFEVDAEGLLAVCIQHEVEHLVGKVFVDHLSPLKRARLAARARKKQRMAG